MILYVIYAYVALGRVLYVGQTKDTKKRFPAHRRVSAFCKEYPDGQFIILEKGLANSQVNNREKYWIAEYQTFENEDLYNRTSGGDGGYIRTDETKHKNSVAAKGQKNAFYGKKHSAETKRKMSESRTGEKNHNYGKTLSAEQKQQISESRKGQKPHNYKASLRERQSLICKYYERGRLSAYQIGKMFQCSANTIRRILHANGVQMRDANDY